MFLPTDLTSSEQDLAATVTRQMLAHRRPASPEEERHVRQEAAQVAAELIQEQRSAIGRDEDPDDDLPESGYHLRMRALLQRDQEILDRQQAEIEDGPLP